MKQYDEAIAEARALLKAKGYYSALESVLLWDESQHLPQAAEAYRHEVVHYFSHKKHELLAGDSSIALADYFSSLSPEDYANDYDRALGRSVLRLRRLESSVPAELQLRLNEAMSNAGRAFAEGRQLNDFSVCEKAYKSLFDLKKEIALIIDPNSDPFETAMDIWDEGISLSETVALFDRLKNAVSTLLKKIQESGKQIDNSVLQVSYDKDAVKSLIKKMIREVGLPEECSSFGTLQHPACEMLGPRDSRIGLNCDNLVFSIISSLHEAGHGIYNIRSDERLIENGLWGGISGAVHEGMARFYENMLGRSRAFWTYYYPQLQAVVPDLSAVSLEQFYLALNKVSDSLIRVSADELSYNLHPIIRFEVERDYFDGKINIDEMRHAWNARYKAYFGREPKDDLEGILQEGHWTIGYIGYFQSYAIGNLWDGQMLHYMLQDIPNVYDEVARGNFKPFNDWIAEHIHHYGNLYAPAELILKATGEPLNADYYITYLKEKYSDLYGLDL